MRTCDVCGQKLVLFWFRYKDGVICRDCYEKASRNCTETIRYLDVNEIKKRCARQDNPLYFGEFEITGRIGNYVLIDDKRRKLCIVNNRLRVKGRQTPEILALEEIRCCCLSCDLKHDWEELQDNKKRKSGYVRALNMELYMNSMQEPKCIKVLSSPVRVKSFAFRKSMDFMQRIVQYLKDNGVECRYV